MKKTYDNYTMYDMDYLKQIIYASFMIALLVQAIIVIPLSVITQEKLYLIDVAKSIIYSICIATVYLHIDYSYNKDYLLLKYFNATLWKKLD